MKSLVTIFLIGIIAFVLLVGFAYSGYYNVSAGSSHSGFTNWLLSTTSHASIKRHANSVEVPNLEDESLKLAGINDFDSMCAGCHGAPGREPEAMGLGLNPPAPDLAEEAAELTAAELFWVTKNGIKLTGMPAWGASHDDSSIWPVVAFMKELPDLDGPAYQAMLESASGRGHHAGDGGDDDHSRAESEESPDSNVHLHDDGSAHIHEAPAEPDDSEALIAIVDAIEKGWEQADGTPFREHYLDFEGARYVESGGQNEGLTDLVEHHVEPEGDALDGLELNLSNVESNIEGDFAWVIADVEVKALVKKDQRLIHKRGYETFLLRRVDGSWKIVHTHSSTRPVK